MRPIIFLLVMMLGFGGSAEGQETGKLLPQRNWHFGLQAGSSRLDRFDVFERSGLPSGEVEEKGSGGAFSIGRRFGQRFILDLQVAWSRHDLMDGSADLINAGGLFTGTVVFREDQVVQPCLKGGFGAGSLTFNYPEGQGSVISYGTAALAGGGAMIRLSSRFTVDLEAAAIFTNYLEVDNDNRQGPYPEESWAVRVSSQGYRLGVGLSIWFK